MSTVVKGAIVSLLLVAVASAAGGTASAGVATSVTTAGHEAAPAATSACRTVVRKVRGKRRRVRVCAKPKSRPRRPALRNISLALDATRTASATIGPAGGTVRAEAAGGVVMALEIPQGALVDDTTITLTPVARLGGLAGIRLRAGVQFGPEGLALAKPATLTIATSTAGVRGLSWWDAGKAVARQPSARVGAGLRIPVAHFSGVAVATGSASAWNGVPDPAAALRARWASEVAPRLDGAGSREPDTSGDFDVAFAWARQVALLGLEGQFAAELQRIVEALEDAIAKAIERAETRCKSGHDLTQVERLTRLDRIAQLFGLRVPGDAGFTRALECMRFTLDVDFDLAFQTSGGGLAQSGRLHVTAHNVIMEPGSTLSPRGGRAVDVASWQFSHTFSVPDVIACTGGPAGAQPTRDLQAILELDPGGAGATLRLDPGDVETLATVTCTPGGSATQKVFDFGALWKGGFADRVGADGLLSVPFAAPSWSGDGATFGPETRAWAFGFPVGPMNVTGTWSLTLRHAPAP